MKQKLNSKKFWDNKITKNFDHIVTSPIYKDKLGIISKFIKNKSGNMLDVGIGYGYLEQMLTKNMSALKLHGVDISKVSINNAIKKYKGVFLQATAQKLPFSDSKFAVVVVLDVLEHLSNTDCNLALKEIYRVMGKGSDLIISVPLNENKHDRITNHHVQVYDSDLLRQQLSRAGFSVLREVFLSAFNDLYFIKSIINRFVAITKPNLLIVFARKI